MEIYIKMSKKDGIQFLKKGLLQRKKKKVAFLAKQKRLKKKINLLIHRLKNQQIQ